MLLGYEQIIELLEVGVISQSSPQLVNHASYAVVGRYNGDTTVQGVK